MLGARLVVVSVADLRYLGMRLLQPLSKVVRVGRVELLRRLLVAHDPTHRLERREELRRYLGNQSIRSCVVAVAVEDFLLHCQRRVDSDVVRAGEVRLHSFHVPRRSGMEEKR